MTQKRRTQWVRSVGSWVFCKPANLGKKALSLVAEILLFGNRVEKEAAYSFLGSLAALTWTTGAGIVVKLLFFPQPTWVDGHILAVACVGAAFGFFAALVSLQECNAWLIPVPEEETKSPYVLFLPSAAILVLGAMMVFVIPLGFVATFLVSYAVPVQIGATGLPISTIKLYYVVCSLRFFFLILQKTASLVIRRRSKRPTHVNRTRIIKYLLLLSITLLFLFLSDVAAFKRLTFTLAVSLWVWGFVCMAWWEHADRRGWGWQEASLASIVTLPVISSLIYALTCLL